MIKVYASKFNLNIFKRVTEQHENLLPFSCAYINSVHASKI